MSHPDLLTPALRSCIERHPTDDPHLRRPGIDPPTGRRLVPGLDGRLFGFVP